MTALRETWPLGTPARERRVALIVVVVFVVAGSAWTLFSDLLLYSMVQDRVVIARIETAKGWAFVALTALLLYAVNIGMTLGRLPCWKPRTDQLTTAEEHR